METPPQKLSLEDLKAWVRLERTKRYADLGYESICRRCGSTVVLVLGYISIHYDGWSVCAGEGHVEKMDLEFCPRCEKVPESVQTCAHLPTFFGSMGDQMSKNRGRWLDWIRTFFAPCS